MGPTHIIHSQVVSACQSFRPEAQFFCLAKVYFLVFFFPNKERGVAYTHACNVPLVILILKLYWFVV